MKRRLEADDETAISDLHITADGRILVFGMSEQIMSLLRDIGMVGTSQDVCHSTGSPAMPVDSAQLHLEVKTS